MNCEQAGLKMAEMLDGGAAGTTAGELTAHCAQCENCRSAYKAFIALKAGLEGQPVQAPGPAFKAGLSAKLEPLTAKPVKARDLLLACAVLMAPALAGSAFQLAFTGSFGASILCRVEELGALTAPVAADGLMALLLPAGGSSAQVQFLTFFLALVTLLLLGRMKPQGIGR